MQYRLVDLLGWYTYGGEGGGVAHDRETKMAQKSIVVLMLLTSLIGEAFLTKTHKFIIAHSREWWIV